MIIKAVVTEGNKFIVICVPTARRLCSVKILPCLCRLCAAVSQDWCWWLSHGLLWQVRHPWQAQVLQDMTGCDFIKVNCTCSCSHMAWSHDCWVWKWQILWAVGSGRLEILKCSVSCVCTCPSALWNKLVCGNTFQMRKMVYLQAHPHPNLYF